ncbi:TRAP transporter large permease [Amphritea sp.]|uniref:TRAP transporter large permease n=1 Tax=Amphritea sp. TaxID=1872502 RepID=UPI003D0B88A3
MDSGLILGGLGMLAVIVMIFLEIPVGVAMGLVGLGGCAWIMGVEPSSTIASSTVWDSLTNYTLTVLPLFVFMGNLASECGLSSRLYSAMRTLIGHRKGGLAIATIGASAGFGMISGSSLATTATMSRIAMPEMKAAGYSLPLSAGTVAAGGSLGILIPPSTVLVIYAFLAEQSINSLLLAAMGPIVLAILLYCLAVYLPVMLGLVKAPHKEKASRADRWASMKEIVPPTGVFALMMGGLYSGIFTANETAAVGVGLVLVYGLLSRRLSCAGMLAASVTTALTCGALYLVLIAANLFNFFLALSGLPFSLSSIFSGLIENPLLLILVMTGIYLLLGTVMDSLAMLLLTIPLFVPIADAAGINLVWFGIYAVMVVELGLITPPVGMNLFIIKVAYSDIRLVQLWQGIAPFVIADLIRIAVIVAIPAIVLWLPDNAH